ncbi:hypothetical protein C6N75_25130 [Streptomyces solincola]|uniref:DUF1206 domain-containing protein n=1 Tax=Streptomyces solincola TaxID=2100817 RepID=A0A2S9PQ48_9ACTN|nr:MULTISPECIES: DUF1206 domain-containing protein [Streptomyces]PRH76534.1 hypothetical protein C6N75_25130 [Streptomyces solincola]
MSAWSTVQGRARGVARDRRGSKVLEWAGRWGFAAKGVIYLLVGVLAVRVAFGENDGRQADRGGALAEVAEKPLGSVVLWAVGVGLVGMALWQLSEALWGTKTGKRLLSAGRCVFYAFVAFSVLAFAAGSGGGGSSDQQSQDVTARAMELPAGRWLVGAVGVGIAIAGVVNAVRAAMRSYHKHLKLGEMSRRARQAVDVTGVAGGIARGLVFIAAGGFAARAAWVYDPDQAKGVDDTLRSFAATPAGPWLLVAVAVGLALYGVFCFAMARWRRV